MITLTDKGKSKISSVGSHGPGAKVLRYLHSNGPTSLGDMEHDLGPGTKRVAKVLYQQGYIHREEG